MSEIGYTVAEVAPQLRCSESKVWRLLKAGDLERVEGQPGRETLVTPDSLAAYIRSLNPASPRKAARPAPAPRAPTEADLKRRREAIEQRRAALSRRDATAAPVRRASAGR